jgi:hypothetical protein
VPKKQRNYKEFDRKIRISPLLAHRHHSAPTRKQIVSTSEDTMQDTDAGCYDFCIERTSDKEGVNESKTSNGGGSRE